MRISNSRCMEYDSITHSEHRCVWMEVSYQEAFGHNMPAIARPKRVDSTAMIQGLFETIQTHT
jgi:hypothetical protein